MRTVLLAVRDWRSASLTVTVSRTLIRLTPARRIARRALADKRTLNCREPAEVMANCREPVRRVPRRFRRLAVLRLTLSLARPAHAESQATRNLTRLRVPLRGSLISGDCWPPAGGWATSTVVPAVPAPPRKSFANTFGEYVPTAV